MPYLWLSIAVLVVTLLVFRRWPVIMGVAQFGAGLAGAYFLWSLLHGQADYGPLLLVLVPLAALFSTGLLSGPWVILAARRNRTKTASMP